MWVVVSKNRVSIPLWNLPHTWYIDALNKRQTWFIFSFKIIMRFCHLKCRSWADIIWICPIIWGCSKWEWDHKEDWEPKNWCFWIVVLEKTLESPLDCREIKLVYPKGSQLWILIEYPDLILKLKLQHSDHMMRRADSLEKTCCWERLRAGGEGDNREWDGWMASLTQWTWIEANSGRQWRREVCCSPRGHRKSRTWLSN